MARTWFVRTLLLLGHATLSSDRADTPALKYRREVRGEWVARQPTSLDVYPPSHGCELSLER